MKRTCGLLAAILCGARPAAALDPGRAITQYVVAEWGPGDGLPSRSVHAVLPGRDGHIWLGTSAGLARFDGARFVVFDASHERAFGDAVVTTLTQGEDGTLLIGTSAAVLRHRDGRFETLPIRAVGGPVFSLLRARDGVLWVGTLGRSMRWREDQPRAEPLDIGPVHPLAMIEDSDGTIWIGTGRKGLLTHRDGRFASVPIGAGRVQALHRDRAGVLWAGTSGGLVRVDEKGPRRLTRADGLPHDDVTAIVSDRDGSLWVGTAGGGLARLARGRWSAIDSRHGLADDHVRALAEDGEGNLWVGTANGLNRVSDGRFATYARAEGLPDVAASAVAGGAGGAVWIGMDSGDVVRLGPGGEAMRHARVPGVERERVLLLHEARDGALWVALHDGRLYRRRGNAFTEETPAEGQVTAVYEDDRLGLVFFVTRVGLARVEGRRARAVLAEARRLSWVHTIVRDRDGTLWMGGAFGLGRWTGEAFRVFTKVDGLPHDRVRSIYEDTEGGLWLATLEGLAHVKGETFPHVGTAHGLPQDHLRLVLGDDRGHLWVASAASIFRLAIGDVRDVFSGRRRRVPAVIFGEGDGLRSTETPLGSAPGVRTADGRLWFATARGLSVVDPARSPDREIAPRVGIDAVRVDGRTQPDHRYPPGRGEVTIDYGARRLAASGRMSFRYRLDGLDDGWTEAGGRRQAHYQALPPGRYRFTVMASNGEGEFNGPAATVAFSIAPPFYRRPPFYAACAAALAVFLGAAHRFRTAQLRARFAAVLDERTRIARELHDTLAQNLTGMAIQMEAALGSISPEEDSAARRHLCSACAPWSRRAWPRCAARSGSCVRRPRRSPTSTRCSRTA